MENTGANTAVEPYVGIDPGALDEAGGLTVAKLMRAGEILNAAQVSPDHRYMLANGPLVVWQAVRDGETGEALEIYEPTRWPRFVWQGVFVNHHAVPRHAAERTPCARFNCPEAFV